MSKAKTQVHGDCGLLNLAGLTSRQKQQVKQLRDWAEQVADLRYKVEDLRCVIDDAHRKKTAGPDYEAEKYTTFLDLVMDAMRAAQTALELTIDTAAEVKWTKKR